MFYTHTMTTIAYRVTTSFVDNRTKEGVAGGSAIRFALPFVEEREGDVRGVN